MLTIEDQRTKKNAYMRDYYARNRDRLRAKQNVYNKNYRAKDPEKCNAASQKSYIKRKTAVLKLFGDKCIRCGFSDSRALQLDHINGDGCRDRINGRASLSYSRLKWIEENPDEAKLKYQLLCANCNWIKRVEEGETR